MKFSKSKSNWRGFTLIELLVVISIIAVLMSVLLPALSKVRAQAKSVICRTRQKDIGMIFRLYMEDNKGQLPPSWRTESEMNGSMVDGDARWFVRIKGYYDLERGGSGSPYDFELLKCPIMEEWARKNSGSYAARGIYGMNFFFTKTDDSVYSWWKRPSAIKDPSSLPLLCDNDTRDPLNQGNEPGWQMYFTNPHPAAYEEGWMNGDDRSGRHHYYGPAPNHGANCNFLMADNHAESRNVCKAGEWPWLGDTPFQQQSGKAFHPLRQPSVKP